MKVSLKPDLGMSSTKSAVNPLCTMPAGPRAACWRLLVCFGLLLVVGPGCNYTRLTAVAGVLTRKELQSGGTGLAAITALGGGEPLMTEQIANRVETQFHEARPWLAITPLETLRATFEPSAYQQTVALMGEHGDWAPDDLFPFQALTNTCRYILLVNVSGAYPGKYSYWSPTAESLFTSMLYMALFGWWDRSCRSSPSENQPETEWERVDSDTFTVETTFGIFDLESRQMVWLAVGRTRMSRDRRGELPAYPTTHGGLSEPWLVDAVDRIAAVVAAHLPK